MQSFSGTATTNYWAAQQLSVQALPMQLSVTAARPLAQQGSVLLPLVHR